MDLKLEEEVLIQTEVERKTFPDYDCSWKGGCCGGNGEDRLATGDADNASSGFVGGWESSTAEPRIRRTGSS